MAPIDFLSQIFSADMNLVQLLWKILSRKPRWIVG